MLYTELSTSEEATSGYMEVGAAPHDSNYDDGYEQPGTQVADTFVPNQAFTPVDNMTQPKPVAHFCGNW